MKDIPKAAFNLSSLKVQEFTFKNPPDAVSELLIDFVVGGNYSEPEGVFTLQLELILLYKGSPSDIPFITIKQISFFEFPDKPSFENLPEYFYQNSIGIVFPYMRAYATTLTAIGNVKPVFLPVMNLTFLGDILKSGATKS